MKSGWIGVDLDGTLAKYHGWEGAHHIGPPVLAMVARVKDWLDGRNLPAGVSPGAEVRIFTARVHPGNGTEADISRIAIDMWCVAVFGRKLPVTHEKDFGMVVLYDDRCVQVEKNTGALICEPGR